MGRQRTPPTVTADQDPEQRIADLERPLLQSAARTELPSDRARVGLRLGWIALALLVIGLIVGAGVILAGRGGSPVSGRPTTPPMIGGGGTVAERPTTPTVSPPAAPTEAAPPLGSPGGVTTVSPPPGEAVSVSGVGNARTIVCADSAVSVSGVDNKVVLTGHCSRVEVSGVTNTVTIEEADAIIVSGLNNAVTFRSGAPELTNSGLGNTLGQK
jgi:hypothetical protein